MTLKHDPKTSPISVGFLQFSAQILGFSADFHRKLLDIVKQHTNNDGIWADGVCKPSYLGPTLVNVSSMVRFDKNKELRKWKNKLKFSKK